jgi:hypothetical protein
MWDSLAVLMMMMMMIPVKLQFFHTRQNGLNFELNLVLTYKCGYIPYYCLLIQ